MLKKKRKSFQDLFLYLDLHQQVNGVYSGPRPIQPTDKESDAGENNKNDQQWKRGGNTKQTDV